MKVYLNASKVSAAIGLNRYETPQQVLTEIFQREEYKDDLEKAKQLLSKNLDTTNVITETETSDIIIKKIDTEIKKIVSCESSTKRNTEVKQLAVKAKDVYKKEAIATFKSNIITPAVKECITENSKDTTEKLDEIKKIITEVINSTDNKDELIRKLPIDVSDCKTKDEITIKINKEIIPKIDATKNYVKQIDKRSDDIEKKIQSKVNTNRGTRDEDLAIKQTKRKIINSNSKTYYCSVKTKDIIFLIGGKVDGWEKDTNIIEEVKNRQNRLFYKIPEYEYVQIQIYLRMTKADLCRHTERYNDTLKTTPVELDTEFWNNKVIPGLEDFAKEFITIYNSPELLIDYI